MNRQLLSIFIIFAIFATYNCAHLKSQANLAQSQEESYDSENFNFFQQSQLKEDYKTEDFNLLQQEQEENYEPDNFNFLQQEEETYEPENFNFLQQQQEEEYEVEEFDYDANLLQTQNSWQVKQVIIAFDRYNVPNVFHLSELSKFQNYNTRILSNSMRIFSAKYHEKMIPLIRLKKQDRSGLKYITVPFQQQDYGFYWYKNNRYTFDTVIGYVYGRDTFSSLKNNPRFICLISVFNRQYQYGGVFPGVYLNQFLSRNRSFTWLKSSMCLPK